MFAENACAIGRQLTQDRFHYRSANSKKLAMREQHPELVEDPSIAFGDLTDKENPVFQYVM